MKKITHQKLKTIVLLLFILSYCIPGSFAQTPNFLWAKVLGGTGDNQKVGIAVDASGNVYTAGSFEGTVDFDPGPGVYNLTSAGNRDISISKLDASGNFVWAKAMGEPSWDYAFSIAVDASGNVYTTGQFQNTVDFDPGAGVFNLTSAGNGDVFISKLDASGNFVWAKAFYGTGTQYGNAIDVDAAGNIYTTGYFYGTVDYDPGPGVFNLSAAGVVDDIYICKLDASGNFAWAKVLGGTGYDEGYYITADVSGNVYTTGTFSGTVDFDPGSGVSNVTAAGNDDIFISKFDASGNFMWARGMGGTGYDGGVSIAIDASGNVYTSGYFVGTADFDPGASSYNLMSAGSQDMFISKLDASGNFVWAKRMGGTSYDVATDLTMDASGSLYITGYYTNTVDLNPGSGIYNLISIGGADVFVSKLDASGNFLWAKSAGGGSADYSFAIFLGSSGNIYVAGNFSSNVISFDGITLTNANGSGTSIDAFVAKLEATTGVESIHDNNIISVYPNPASMILNVSQNQYTNYDLRVMNILGEEVQLIAHQSTPFIQIDISKWKDGVYFYCLTPVSEGEEAIRGKFIVQK
jgi:hypothetical protein